MKNILTGMPGDPIPRQEGRKLNPLESLSNREVRQQVLMSLCVLFCELGLNPQDAEDLVWELDDLVGPDFAEETFVSLAREKMKKYNLDKRNEEFSKLFVKWKYDRLKPYLGQRVLDVGAGSGEVGKMIATERGAEVTLVDVVDFNKTDLPCLIYDGANLPVETESQDTALLLCSLHHSFQPEQVLAEARRVASEKVLVLESVFLDNEVDKQKALFVDWFIARVLDETGMDYAGNLHSVSEWEKIFEGLGFVIEVSEDAYDGANAKIDLISKRAVSERAWFFVLTKKHE